MLGDSPPFGEGRLRALLRLLSLALRRGLALGRLFYGLALCCFLFCCHVNQLLSVFTVGFYLPIGARVRVSQITLTIALSV